MARRAARTSRSPRSPRTASPTAVSYISVKVGVLPGSIQEYVLNGDRTVQAALTVSGHEAQGYQVRVNGELAELTSNLNDGDTVLLLEKVVGA